MRLLLILLLLFVLLVYPSFLKAHGDLDLRIQEVTTAIESYPDSAALYFHRGKLRFQHEEYDASVADIETSIDKGFYDELQYIYMAKCHHQLESYKVANQYVDLFLRNDPDNVVGLKLKGRILYSMQEYDSSAIYFEKVIQLSIRTLPENYLETAQSWTASALPDKYQKATNILELGLKNLGAVITLQNALIELHIQNQNKEKAFELQLKILENTKRKESAYVKLAELYIQFEEMEKAKSALIDAKAEWEKLPLRIRNNASMSSLIEKIEQLLTNLN